METEEKIKEFVLETLVEGKELITDNAPQLVTEYIQMQAFTHGSGAVGSFLIGIISIIILYRHVKAIKLENGGKFNLLDGEPTIIAFTSVVSVIGFLLGVKLTVNCLQIYLFPNAYLLEQFLQ